MYTVYNVYTDSCRFPSNVDRDRDCEYDYDYDRDGAAERSSARSICLTRVATS
jgi:hypothetical protein